MRGTLFTSIWMLENLLTVCLCCITANKPYVGMHIFLSKHWIKKNPKSKFISCATVTSISILSLMCLFNIMMRMISIFHSLWFHCIIKAMKICTSKKSMIGLCIYEINTFKMYNYVECRVRKAEKWREKR